MCGIFAAYFLLILLLNITEFNSNWNGVAYAVQINQTCVCGLSPVLSTYIVNGNEVADMRMYPWLVSIHDTSRPNEQPWGNCAGALISANTVVTAAHCLYWTTNCPNDKAYCLYPLDVLEIGLLGPSQLAPARRIRASKFIPHPGFDRKYLKNDIAVIKLSESLPCTEYSRPICLSNKDLIKTNNVKKVQVAGWGRVSSFEVSNVLRDGFTSIVDASLCRSYKTNPSQTICALGKVQYACHGDSGSPAVMRNFDQFYIVGVTSGGQLFCPLGLPLFYTRTDAYYPFIIHAMNSP